MRNKKDGHVIAIRVLMAGNILDPEVANTLAQVEEPTQVQGVENIPVLEEDCTRVLVAGSIPVRTEDCIQDQVRSLIAIIGRPERCS